MISADGVVPILLVACPSFASVWAGAEQENLDDDGRGRLHYLDAGDFVRHVVALKRSGETAEFDAVFDAIELLLTDGDDFVRNLAAVGYIEGFQMMTVAAAGLDPERDFLPCLRPSSARMWGELNEQWAAAIEYRDRQR